MGMTETRIDHVEDAGGSVPAGQAWTTPAPGEIVAVPGEIMVLDQGVPWIRSGRELRYEWDRLSRHATLLPDPDASGYREMTGGLKALLGVLATARWCLARTTTMPMSARPGLVTGASIKAELALAETVVNSRQGNWEYATGVLMWLLWVTGASEKTVYLSW